MLMKPGATARPVASTVTAAGVPARSPTAAMLIAADADVDAPAGRPGPVVDRAAADDDVETRHLCDGPRSWTDRQADDDRRGDQERTDESHARIIVGAFLSARRAPPPRALARRGSPLLLASWISWPLQERGWHRALCRIDRVAIRLDQPSVGSAPDDQRAEPFELGHGLMACVGDATQHPFAVGNSDIR